MKIQVYMPVFNEADILPHTLRHLHEQGCDVHIIDGWSTDGSFGIARAFFVIHSQLGEVCGVTFERFPAKGPDLIQNCTAILKRIEDLAADSDADWCMYSDADEWRRSPNPNYRLVDHVCGVEMAGFNAIDFRVFQFYCVDRTWADLGWVGSMTPESFFQHYDEADCISRIPNRKLWKNVGRVQLAGGGHEVTFPGMRVYPQKFVMKHYPFRTPAQAKAKIETRLARRCAEEHTKGWGVHYDQYPPGFDFCWDPAKLLYWKDTRSPLP